MSTASETSVYQALRGHLATLRLAAAAEALPGVLEAARSEALGHTAMLERLLGIEVTATEARKTGEPRAVRLAAGALAPRRLRLRGPAVGRPGARQRARHAALPRGRHQRPVHRTTGVGKTMLATGLARAAVEGGYRAYYTTAADLAARCHRAAIEGRWAATICASSPGRSCS